MLSIFHISSMEVKMS